MLADFTEDARLHVAGYNAVDYSDHSVVGHARRFLGHNHGTAITGGALVIRCAGPLPFFTNCYNEDWLFLLGLMLEETSSTPSSAVKYVGPIFQEPYDPFHPSRAQAEELGDLLGEGLFRMIGTSREELLATACTPEFWKEIGRQRRDEILDLLVHTRHVGRSAHVDRIYEALSAALSVYVQTGQWTDHLAGYLRCWQSDLTGWPDLIDRLTPSHEQGPADLPAAIAYLGLAEHTTWLGGRVGNFTALQGRGS